MKALTVELARALLGAVAPGSGMGAVETHGEIIVACDECEEGVVLTRPGDRLERLREFAAIHRNCSKGGSP